MAMEKKLARVEEVIMELGLNGCRHTRIGGPDQRGVSGGERKRVSIAIEIVAQPSILFLDEPTSGLDAFTAVNIIDTIKRLAVSQRKIVLMTIHQPRTDILEMFDKIALLSIGRLSFFGDLPSAIDHFQALGFPLPPKTNPSDFFLDVITLDQRSPELKAESSGRIAKFHEAWDAHVRATMPPAKGAATLERERAASPIPESAWPSPWTKEFTLLLRRNMTNIFRDFRGTIAMYFQSLFLVVSALCCVPSWHGPCLCRPASPCTKNAGFHR
jgi:ABC-type multidrug transport system ATPase subunit